MLYRAGDHIIPVIIIFTFIHQYYMVDIINNLNINELK